LLALTAITKKSIDAFFPPLKAFAPYITTMSYTVDATATSYLYVWLVYGDMYPGKTIDQTNIIDLNNLKDIYLMENIPWNDDPILTTAVKNGKI
jgi:hypothetical protein